MNQSTRWLGPWPLEAQRFLVEGKTSHLDVN
jgi:hypothetical protein